MDPLSLALIGAGGAIIAAIAGAGVTVGAQEYFSGRKKKKGVSFGLSIIIVGLSKTGKTTFINAFLNEPKADHGKRTEGTRVFKRTIPLPEDPEILWDIEVLDYDGREPSLLTEALQSSKLSFPPTVLGVIIDPAETDTKPGVDKDRIQEHLDTWNATSLSLLKGVAGSVAYTWVYFNKLDLVPADELVSVDTKYEPIILALKAAFPSANSKLEVYKGSLNTGTHIPEIIRRCSAYKTVVNR